MPYSNTVMMQSYSGSLLSLNLLSGTTNNLVLNALGARSATTLTENSNQLLVGEVVNLGGQQVEVLGSGTVQAGVKVLGLTVPLGASYHMVLVKDVVTGGLSFVYPQGAPALLDAVALMVTAKPQSYTFPGGVLCFAHGTLIDTPHGPVPVERLRPNQRVLTLDAGPRPVKWLLDRDLSAADLADRPHLLPVRIPAHALGPGRPARDLLLSPQHRVLIDSPRAVDAHGGAQVLVAALHLVGFAGITIERPPSGVGYVHVILTRHALLRAEGCVAESFYTGAEGMRGLDSAAREQVARLYLGQMRPARPMLRRQAAQALVADIIARGEALQPGAYLWDQLGEGGAVRED